MQRNKEMRVIWHKNILADRYAVLLGPNAERIEGLVNIPAGEQLETLVGVECDKIERSQVGKARLQPWRACRITRATIVAHDRICNDDNRQINMK
jgi:hypothetical protein